MKKAKVGQKVVDRWFSFGIGMPYGFGKIKKVTTRSCYIKFQHLDEVQRYDREHLEQFVALFKESNMMPNGFIKENKFFSLTLK